MAIYNEILVGRYPRMLQKLFSMKGAAPTKQLAGEVTVTLNLFSGVENRFLESWDRFGQALNIPAAATFQSGVRVRNPAGSNIIVVFERITYSETANDQPFVTFGADSTDLTTVVGIANTTLDRRTARPSPTVIMSRQNTTAVVPALASTTTLENIFIGANVPREMIAFEDQELLLSPGMAMQISANAVNQALVTTWIWRERFLEESERQ